MAKGFKDSSGKFHPIGNNGRKSSKEKSIQATGINKDREKGLNQLTSAYLENVTKERLEKALSESNLSVSDKKKMRMAMKNAQVIERRES